MSYTPTQTLTKNTVTGNWELNENGTDRTYINTLNTDNKVVSGDIKLNISAKSATVSTPTISQSTVVDNQIVFTPSIEITGSGWVDNGTITGESVTIGASDLVSGTIPVTKYGPNSWNIKSWGGFDFYGQDIWTDNANIYYSSAWTQKVLNKSTGEWEDKTWTGLTSFYGQNIWTDGENIYYSHSTAQYVLDKTTSTWIQKTWTGLTNFIGNKIWTDGENIYYSNSTSQKILDKATSTWSDKTWTGLSLTTFNGQYVWSDGTNIYFSSYSTQKILDKATSTWSAKAWIGLSSFNGDCIWTDGDNIYYSYQETQKVLNKSTSTWTDKTWGGFKTVVGSHIWTDGTNIYYSSLNHQYVYYEDESNNEYTDVTNYKFAYVPTEIATITPSNIDLYITPSYNSLISEVIVKAAPLISQVVTPSINSITLYPSGTYIGYNMVMINAIQTETKTVKSTQATQTITPTSDKFINEVIVEPVVVQSKTVTPTTATQTISPDNGYDYLSQVVVEPGMNPTGTITITQQTGTDVTNYANADVQAAIINNPVATTGTVSSNQITITPSVEISQSGWVNSGTYSGTPVSVSASQLVSGTTPVISEPNSWLDKYWQGYIDVTEFMGNLIWTDGDNIYLSTTNFQGVLNKSTKQWQDKYWQGLRFNGYNVWTDSENIYLSESLNQYVLNKSTSTWSTKSWQGLTSFSGQNIWTDGTNIYYSSGSSQYVLDKATSTWSTKSWSGLTVFDGVDVWTDGTNIYYSSDSTQYVLDKSTSTWTTKTWTGLTNPIGRFIWTDGTNIYYSNGADQYILDKTTSTWTAKLWTGLIGFDGCYIWTDGENIYFSDSIDQYQLAIKQDITNYQYIESNFNSIKVTPTNEQQVITASSGSILGNVIVEPGGMNPTGTITITQQTGTDVTNYASANVQSGSVTITVPDSNVSYEFDTLLGGASITYNNQDEYVITSNNTFGDLGATVTSSVNAGWISSVNTPSRAWVYLTLLPGTVSAQTVTVTPTTATQTITPSAGYFLGKVTVVPPTYETWSFVLTNDTTVTKQVFPIS